MVAYASGNGRMCLGQRMSSGNESLARPRMVKVLLRGSQVDSALLTLPVAVALFWQTLKIKC